VERRLGRTAGTVIRGCCVAALALIAACAHRQSYNYGLADAPILRTVLSDRPAPAGSTLTVVSYNIKYGKEVEQALRDLRADSRLAAADVLLLQEMAADGVERMARALGLNAVYVPSSRDETGRGFGNAILANTRLEDIEAVALPHRHPLTGQTRIALLATAVWSGRRLRIACVHLETPPLPLEQRLDQLAAVCSALPPPAAGPVVVGGDFNTVSDYEVTAMARRLRREGLHQVNTGVAPTAVRGFLGLELFRPRLDHLFVRDLVVLGGGVTVEAEASDHRPIWSVLAWSR
jgi:endonuclease/exonuclease/phosphatase family metal-dependent hydrolase